MVESWLIDISLKRESTIVGWKIINLGVIPIFFPFPTRQIGHSLLMPFPPGEDGVFLTGGVDAEMQRESVKWTGVTVIWGWVLRGDLAYCGERQNVGGMLQRKGNCYKSVCGCAFVCLFLFLVCLFKPLKSRTNMIFQQFLLVTGLYFCNNLSIPHKQEAHSNLTKDSEISFDPCKPKCDGL